MSYYDTNLKYLMDDLLIYCYNFKPIKDKIIDAMKNKKLKISMITAKLIATSPKPESEFIQSCYNERKIKSYQLKEVCTQIHQTLKGALNSNLEQSLNIYTTFKDNIKIKIETKRNAFEILIQIKNIKNLTPSIIFAIINHFNVDILGYCDSVQILLTLHDLVNKTTKIILNDQLEKVPLVEQLDFFTLDTKDKVLEFYKCPEVKEILFKFFFPNGLDSDIRTEITFDMLRKATFPQKRRKIYIPTTGDFINFHDAITPYTTHQEFLDLIEKNNILDFYPSVRLVKNGNITTALIDIDVSGFLKTAFSQNLIWEFTITLTKELIKTLTKKLCLPYPLVTFSGSKGVHILYKIDPDSISSEYGYVNFWELYLLPGQKALTKNESSILRSNYTFMRTIIEAIILYTLDNLAIETIPQIIREELGIMRAMDLFKLSPFDDANKVGILVDSSPNNGSVSRIFSIHPTSGLVSIPITNPKTKLIDEKFTDYDVLKGESSVSTIVRNFKEGKKVLYDQYPPMLNREHIESLLEPTKLLPVISTIVRFSDRWVMHRSSWSYRFWFEFYQLNNFYDYLSKIHLNGENRGQTYQKIRKIIDDSTLKMKELVQKTVDSFFFQRRSFNSLKHKLDAYRDLEFFYRFKFEEIREIHPDRITLYFEEEQERRNFLRKFKTFFNITLVLINDIVENAENIAPKQKQALFRMYVRLFLLDRIFKSFESERNEDYKLHTENKFIQIICVFNIFVKFVREQLRAYKFS